MGQSTATLDSGADFFCNTVIFHDTLVELDATFGRILSIVAAITLSCFYAGVTVAQVSESVDVPLF